MADENPTTLPVQSGILDPLVGAGFFSPNMTLEEIKRRRAIGAALASRARGYPKTVGEGMTYFGESLAEAFADRKLAEAEKGYNERYNKAAGVPAPNDTLPPAVTPSPVAAPSPVAPLPAAVPSPAPPAPRGPMAAVDPLTVEPPAGPASRAAIAQVLARRNGAVPPGPTVTAGSPPPILARGGGAPGADGGENFTLDEGGPNPPIINSEIRPMMVAEARSPASPPAAPVQPPAALGGALKPYIPDDPGPMPPAPERSERMTPNEQYRANVLRQFPGDERALREFNQAHELGKVARDAEYERQKKEHDVRVQEWVRRRTERDAAVRGADEKQLELQQKGATSTKAQADEATRLQWGNLPAPVQKDLFESRDAAKAAAGSIGAMNNAEAVLNAGTVVGPGAALALAYHKAKGFAGNEESQRIVANTQTFQATLGPAVMAAVKAYGGPQVSNTDREYAAAMIGSDIALSENAIRKILDIGKRSAALALAEHRTKTDEHAKDAPALHKFLQVSDPLAAVSVDPVKSTAAPAATGKTYNEGDIARGKPGQPDLVRRGGKWVPL